MRNCLVSKPTPPPLLVFADDWGRHPSSCQHLIRRLREDRPILWANTVGTRQVKADSFTLRRGVEKIKNWSKGLKQVDRQMWTIDLPMLPGMSNRPLREINRHLVTARLRGVLAELGMESPIVLTTLPYIGWLIRGLRRRGLVYYCTDDYSHWPSADRETLQRAEGELCREANLILAASQALYRRLAPTGHCEYFPHGVDFAHFASVGELPDSEPALAQLPRPRIGFFGLIYEKLDFALLTGIAERFREGSLVLIGPHAYSPPEFGRLANVHLLGQKPYEDLPRYLAGLDVLLLPYVDDAMIRQSGPLKLRECLASGKPTVSIDVPEVRALQPHVRVASDRQAFLHEVREALEEPLASSRGRARQQAVEADGWDSRARQLAECLQRLQPASRTAGARRAAAASSTNGHPHRPGRVLHLRTVSGRGGGPEKTILNSPRFLTETYEMRLAYIRPENDPEYDMPQRARQMGVDLIDVPERGGFDPRTVRRLAKEIRAFRPDILHAHDYKTNVLAVLLGRWFDVPVMTTLHGYGIAAGRLAAYYQLDRWSLRRMAHVVAVSEDLYQTLLDLRIPASRRSLIANGIDAEEFQRRRSVQEAKAALGMSGARLMIGAIGRLTAVKGFDLLIRAVDQLVNQGLDVELFIVGEGEERPRLQETIAQLGRSDRIHLLGHRSDVREIYEAMDVYALSSFGEGLPNVLLEAMALEVPIVATRVGGVARLVADEENGLLVEPGDRDGLTQALARLLQDPDLCDRLRQAGRETVETRYSFQARMEKVRALYDNVLASRKVARKRGQRTRK
jgi:glycosyltransferase involved in cell wall biosynthesis